MDHTNHSMMDHMDHINHGMMDKDHNMMDNDHHMMDKGHSMMDNDQTMMNHSMSVMNHTVGYGLHTGDIMNHTFHHGHHGIDDSLHAEHDMYFTFDFPRVIVLQGWTVTSITELTISLLGLCIIAIFLESLARITKRATSKTLCYMAKKNLRGFEKRHQRLDNTAAPVSKGDDVASPKVEYSVTADPEVNTRKMSQGLMRRTLSVELGVKWENNGANKRVEKVVQLTFPQCFQYRLLLTILHVIQAMLAYFLMLALMTYNWWVFIVILAGSVLGFLLFGQGTRFYALENMTSSALPPDFVSGSTLNNMDSVDTTATCFRTNATELSCHDESSVSRTDPERFDEVLLPLVRQQNDLGSKSKDLEHVESLSGENHPFCDGRKVQVRIDLQGDVVSDLELMDRLKTSKETEV